ncbi:MAG: hypothetical protein HQ592_06385 [Planctomycetes bacterium]|nr:hypothetical protein [Planctomycetota bacterium]
MARTFSAAISILIICLAVAGCASPVRDDIQAVATKDPVFFPPAPEEPRIQFLCNLKRSEDTAPEAGWLERFIVGERPTARKTIVKPYGVAIRDGKVYVADSGDSCIVVMDMRNKRRKTLGNTGPGKLKMPINIFFAEDGLLYVADTVRNQVLVYRPDGTYVTAYGETKDFRPADVLVYGEEVFVLNIKEHNIKVYDKKTRKLKRTLGARGVEPGEYNYPSNFALDSDGHILVSDMLNFRVQKIDVTGTPLLQFGKAGDTPGRFALPKGIAVDREGIVYVVDNKMRIVKLFNKEGRALMHFGGAGDEDGNGGLLLPAQVIVDYDNLELFREYIAPSFDAQYLILVTSQYGKNKVSVFAFGTSKVVAQPTEQ